MAYKNPEKNLPKKGFTTETAKKAGSKPKPKGRAHPNSLIMKIKWLRQKGITNDNAEKLYNYMTDPNFNSVDILLTLKTMKEVSEDPKEILKITQHLMEWQKMQHGEKKSIDLRSININLEQEAMTPEFARLIEEHFEDEYYKKKVEDEE